MDRKTREAYRGKLLALRDRLSGNLAHLEEETPSPAAVTPPVINEPGDRGDRSVGIYAESINLALAHNEETLLDAVNAALERMERGRFGKCEACGEAIARRRLDAAPYTRHCFRCARGDRESDHEQ